jgi:tetratricopeptide (TPR) repeat protein
LDGAEERYRTALYESLERSDTGAIASSAIELSVFYSGRNEPAEALKILDKVLKILPSNASIFAYRGSILGSLGRNAEALESLDRAIQINPGLASAWKGRAHVLMNLGDFTAALDSIKQGLAASSNDEHKSFFINSLVDISLNASLHEAKQENGSISRAYFTAAAERFLELSDSRYSDTATQHFFHFFKHLSDLRQHRLSSSFLAMFDAFGLVRLHKLLFPFEIANRYWESNQDSEILDRLNPEIREIVEELILKGGEDMKNENG